MERQHINPPGLFTNPAYTRIVTVEGPAKIAFFAGQTATDAENNCVGPGDYLVQYRCIMDNLTRLLEAVGATWDDVVFKRQYVLDVAKYREAANDPENPSYWSPDRPPPSTLIGVAQLARPEFVMEVEIVSMVSADPVVHSGETPPGAG